MLALDRAAFIDALADVPPKPAEMDQIVSYNRGQAPGKGRAER
jgi:hypothetical protein